MTARKKRVAHKARAARLLELLHDCNTWNEAVKKLTEEAAEGGTNEGEDIRATGIQNK